MNLPTSEQSSKDTSQSATDQKGSEYFVRSAITKANWIIASVIAILILALLVFGWRLQSLSTQFNALESKSASLLSSAMVGKEAGKTESGVSNLDVTQAEVLKLLPFVEQISALLPKVAQLPIRPEPLKQNILKPQESTLAPKASTPAVNAEIKWWRQVGEKIWVPIRNFFHDLIKIQVIDEELGDGLQGVALTSATQQLVRHEIRIYLLNAKQLLLAGLTRQALAEIVNAHQLVNKNFAIQSKNVVQFIEDLERIEMQLKASLPSSNPATPAGKK